MILIILKKINKFKHLLYKMSNIIEDHQNTELINKLYSQFVNIMNGVSITSTNIMSISITLMKIVEKNKKISGQMKKELVIHLIRKFVIDNTSPEDIDNILFVVNYILPNLIDTIISIDKKEIIIATKKTFSRCC